ncbi:LysR family transcriptional regulator [Bacillus badius]|uniref:Transcriptional regulator, LysR family n=1 Tax=Bacillus badius TaxID=1455 RepID=A0ABR5AXG0_BACBA|nr:LysR family transcriptional regulator [Bacillus badius]KIL76016.1 Transcriptional regulator, LysR family [Bacillus badius]KIL79424.1 Transcriptional regulator, LysR family [Bacillus badius]KZR59658.1 LysR family transcriptional regulator [Bacillus badius]MED4716599.1 LysR family transcriptional regulator [Bacillus badius]
MDIRQIRYFATIAEEGQITKAAKKLHMAQPPLSQQLKSLEEELGVLLLERKGRKLELTEAGKVLYKKAKHLLEQMEETIVEVKEVGDGLKGVLSIGSVKTCFSYIPERFLHFREKYPRVKFRLKEGDSSLLANYVKQREVELAIVRLPLEMEEFSYLPLPTDPFVAVMPENPRTPTVMQMKELSGMPLMLLHRVSGVGLYELVINECKRHDFEPNIICECPDAAMLLSLVRTGLGTALLPKSTLLSFPTNGLQIVEIEDCTIQSESAIIWLKDRYLSKKAERFLNTFRAAEMTINS